MQPHVSVTRIARSLLVAVAALPGGILTRAESRLSFDFGYRTGQLDWNIAGNLEGENPDVLSELSYERLGIVELRVDWETTLGRRYVFGARGGFGVIVTGENRDSDFAGDGRTFEWSRSNNSADGDDVFDVAVAFGCAFQPGGSGRTRIVPRLGYSYNAQNMRMTDGHQTLVDNDIAALFDFNLPPIGPFEGLDSTYEARWFGPWIGVAAERRFGDRWGLSASGELHWADYDAEANWNLRDEFAHPKSFDHSANGTGLVASASLHRQLFGSARVRLRLDYEDWSTDPGVDRVFFADGTQPTTRLNEVNWQSFAIYVGFDLLRSMSR